MTAAAVLFPDLAGPDAKPRENTLSDAERQALVAGVVGLCRKMARDTAGRLGRAGRHFESEDLEGEAFVAACQAAREWDPARGVKFSTFCGSFVVQHLVAVADQRYTPPVGLLSRPEFVPAPEVDGDDDAGEGPETREPNEYQVWLLSKLPEPTRTVVRLVSFDGLTPDQAAEQLAIPPKDAKLMIRNAAAAITKAGEADIRAEERIEKALAQHAGAGE